jgi:hypothetical protein
MASFHLAGNFLRNSEAKSKIFKSYSKKKQMLANDVGLVLYQFCTRLGVSGWDSLFSTVAIQEVVFVSQVYSDQGTQLHDGSWHTRSTTLP